MLPPSRGGIYAELPSLLAHWLTPAGPEVVLSPGAVIHPLELGTYYLLHCPHDGHEQMLSSSGAGTLAPFVLVAQPARYNLSVFTWGTSEWSVVSYLLRQAVHPVDCVVVEPFEPCALALTMTK